MTVLTREDDLTLIPGSSPLPAIYINSYISLSGQRKETLSNDCTLFGHCVWTQRTSHLGNETQKL